MVSRYCAYIRLQELCKITAVKIADGYMPLFPRIDALGSFHIVEQIANPREIFLGNTETPIHAFMKCKFDALALAEMYECLGMLFLGSPRVRADDYIDPYLSRYYVPDFGAVLEAKYDDNNAESVRGSSDAIRDAGILGRECASLSRTRWHGFISAPFVQRLFLAVLRFIASDQTQLQWAALNVSCFGGANYTVLIAPGGSDCFLWHCK